MQKLYCYVDESGQDTQGQLFIVVVVIVGEERETLRQICLEIEAHSRKGMRKWAHSNQARRQGYVEALLRHSEFQGKFYYTLHRSTQDYLAATVQTITQALDYFVVSEYKATILIDGLPRSIEREVGRLLRRSGLPVQKVRGVNDESELLIRLADALCGFVRKGEDGNGEMTALLERALSSGWLVELR